MAYSVFVFVPVAAWFYYHMTGWSEVYLRPEVRVAGLGCSRVFCAICDRNVFWRTSRANIDSARSYVAGLFDSCDGNFLARRNLGFHMGSISARGDFRRVPIGSRKKSFRRYRNSNTSQYRRSDHGGAGVCFGLLVFQEIRKNFKDVVSVRGNSVTKIDFESL